MRSLITKLHPKLAKFRMLYAINANIIDFTRTIANDSFTLIKITPKNRDRFVNLLRATFLNTENSVKLYSEFGNYILAAPLFDVDRIECYLHNKLSNSLFLTNTIILTIDTSVPDWTNRKPPSKTVFDLKTKYISEIVSAFTSGQSPTISDLDVQLILKRLELDSRHKYLYRGIKQIFQAKDGISASIYRNNPEIAKNKMLQDHEKYLVNKLQSKKHYKMKENVAALTDLRHSGKDTCLLDYSKDSMVALFFACQNPSDRTTDGEILYFDQNIFKQKREINYPEKSDIILRPTDTPTTKQRVSAQKSVFVYCHNGYLPRDTYSGRIKNLQIYKGLKEVLLDHCSYNEDDIYPDFHGFIDNPKNFETPATVYASAQSKSDKGNVMRAFMILKEYQKKLEENRESDESISQKIKEYEDIIEELGYKNIRNFKV